LKKIKIFTNPQIIIIDHYQHHLFIFIICPHPEIQSAETNTHPNQNEHPSPKINTHKQPHQKSPLLTTQPNQA
jgi:hypothetical protein